MTNHNYVSLGNGNYIGHKPLPEKWDTQNKCYGSVLHLKNVTYKIPGRLFLKNGKLRKSVRMALKDGVLSARDENFLIKCSIEFIYKAAAKKALDEVAEAGWGQFAG